MALPHQRNLLDSIRRDNCKCKPVSVQQITKSFAWKQKQQLQVRATFQVSACSQLLLGSDQHLCDDPSPPTQTQTNSHVFTIVCQWPMGRNSTQLRYFGHLRKLSDLVRLNAFQVQLSAFFLLLGSAGRKRSILFYVWGNRQLNSVNGNGSYVNVQISQQKRNKFIALASSVARLLINLNNISLSLRPVIDC